MKKVLTIAALLLSSFVLSAQVIYPDPSIFNGYSGGEDAYVNLQNTIENAVGNITIALMPFDGAYGVNMRDTRYPARDVAGNSMLTYENLPLNSFSSTSNLDKYNDEQMILMGGVEGVPSSLCDWVVFDYRYEEHKESSSGYPPFYGGDVPNFRVRFKDGVVENAEIVINSSTDFMYISQSNPIYQREYRLYVVPSSIGGGNPPNVPPDWDWSTVNNEEFTTISKNGIRKADLKFNQDKWEDRAYLYSWFDLVLALPYDQVNETGVVLDNVEYPLADSDDYSSVITAKITWRQPFEIEYSHGNYRDYDIWPVTVKNIWTGEGEWEKVSEGEIIYTTVLSIPFSGFSSTIESGPLDDTGSLVITPYPAASNLSLDAEDTGGDAIPVAEIQFIMTYGSTENELNPSTSNTWIFLSASPDPYASNPNGFMLVHDEAGSILTSYNSTPYTVTVTGITANSDGAGGDDVVFDGKEKAADFYLNQTGPDSYIHTEPNYNLELPHTHGKYSHYSEYEGIVSVQIPRTPVAADGMRAGRYTSEIYIHVMTGE